MNAKSVSYVSPASEVVEILFEGTVLTGSQVVGGGSESGGFEDEEYNGGYEKQIYFLRFPRSRYILLGSGRHPTGYS